MLQSYKRQLATSQQWRREEWQHQTRLPRLRYLPELALDDVAAVLELISWAYSEVTTPRIAVCTLFVAHVPGHAAAVAVARRYRSGCGKISGGRGKSGGDEGPDGVWMNVE